MKKILPILLLLMSLSISAQSNKRERIKALKVAFITENLDLSEKEAQQFWPVYNAFEKEVSALRYNEFKVIRNEIRDHRDTMTDDMAKTLLERHEKAEIKMHKIKKEFSNNLSNILSPKKTILLKLVEEDFKKKMFEEFKKRKRERG